LLVFNGEISIDQVLSPNGARHIDALFIFIKQSDVKKV